MVASLKRLFPKNSVRHLLTYSRRMRWRRVTGSRTRRARRWGISTTVEFVSVRATRGPKDGAVWASYCAEMTSVGLLLWVMSRMERDTGGTFQTSQFERMNWRFGAFLWTHSGNLGNARRPAAMTLLALSQGTHSPQETP